MAGEEKKGRLVGKDLGDLPSLFTVEPQGSASILDSERPFREGGRSGGDWLETGVNAGGIGSVILQVNEEIKK